MTTSVTKTAPAKKVKKTSSKPKKMTKPVVEQPEPVQSEPVPTPVPVVTEVATEQSVNVVGELTTVESSMVTTLGKFSETIQELTITLNKVKAEFKTLEKQVLKEAKTMDKINAKRNRNKGSRAPSGFVKPAKISEELSVFLGVPPDTMMARTDVTKLITKYVKAHSLQAQDNGRKILPDDKLNKLLKVEKGDEVTYFNLQKYMKPHFIKSV
jgi:upstream activation factor subunit UAF30|tara:strand:- start:3486 stop:4121 length:636 start_codon:yes stop_codon:yes gene_type:complete